MLEYIINPLINYSITCFINVNERITDKVRNLNSIQMNNYALIYISRNSKKIDRGKEKQILKKSEKILRNKNSSNDTGLTDFT